MIIGVPKELKNADSLKLEYKSPESLFYYKKEMPQNLP